MANSAPLDELSPPAFRLHAVKKLKAFGCEDVRLLDLGGEVKMRRTSERRNESGRLEGRSFPSLGRVRAKT
jgi:hypothetical protein